MGSKLVRVTGKLQCEADVVHIVAQQMEDLTPWLAELSEQASMFDTLMPADEVKHPGIDQRGRRSRHADRVEATANAHGKTNAAMEKLTLETSRIMPKGRNFQ
jgi:hypothetical protein